jgi:hypothetical protein
LLAKYSAGLGLGRRGRQLRQNGAGKKSRPTEWHDGTTDHVRPAFSSKVRLAEPLEPALMAGLALRPVFSNALRHGSTLLA